MASDFYLVLPSNASMTTHPNNTLAQYITNLPRRISLSGGGEWECGLTEIHYPHDWYNVRNARLMVEHDGETETDANFVTFYYQPVTQKFVAHMKGDTKFALYGDLPDILGFGMGDAVTTFRSSARSMLVRAYSIVDLRRGFESLYVYSSIVEPRIVGDKIAPLLRIVPITGRHGEMVTARFDHVQYMPVLSREFEDVEIEIRDDTGRPVPFERGKVTVTLHLRRRRTGYFSIALRRGSASNERRKMNYDDYYAQQVGGVLPYVAGARLQRGHGFGSLFGGLLRTVAPLIKRGALALGNRALKTGAQIAGDVLSRQNIRTAAKRRTKTAGRDLLQSLLATPSPPGKRVKRAAPKRTTKRRRAARIRRIADADVFS